ncbi:MAG TPA: tetratricopeptide repeat-containing sensor histidine kinase [Ignavibacteriales bacterium]|nr:tetratricopeptide repeat-containing sensor histidine kinase [Ignavibacteriales bacterium]
MKPALFTLTAAFLLCFESSLSAFNKPDSLETLIKKKNGIEKIDLILSLADYCQNADPQKGLKVASEALRMSEELNYAKGKALSYANLGEMYMNLSDFNSALENHKRALEVRESSGDSRGVAMSLNSIGGALEHLGKYDQAIKYYYKAIKIEESNSDTKGLSVSYSLVATLHYILEDYPRALDYCSRAMQIREKLNDRQGLSNSYELMGLINYDFKKFDESLKYHLMALKVKTELNERVGVAGSYQNLGMVYRKLQKYDLAIDYFSKALKLREELGDKRGIAASLTSLGEIYEVQGKLHASLDHFSRAFQIRQEIKDKRGLVRSYFHLSKIYEKMGNYKKAFDFRNLYFTYKDSLNNAQALHKLTALDMQYKSEKKDQEIALLQKDSIIQKTVRNSLIAGVLLVTVIAVGIFAAYRSKKKTNLLLEEKNREITGHHEELKRLNEELKISNATKDKFFSIIAHDLKSPFFGFLGISGELAENSKNLSQEEISEYAGLVNQSAKKIFELVNNLLEWSLLQSERISMDFAELRLYDEVENIKDLFKSSALNKSITVINEVQENDKARADKKMVETILRNLISNAIKFTGVGGRVSVSSRLKGEFLEISVSDSGIGMSPELTEKIFRIDSVYSQKGTRGESGSGLGLILCKELVEKNGGSLSVESRLGKGTTFSFTLPLFRHEAVETEV